MKYLLFLLCTISSLTTFAFETPNQCATPPRVEIRIEWRKLSKSSQAEYISAVKCLDKMQSQLGLKTSRYNDFPYVHRTLNVQIEFNLHLLHNRYFVHLYETSLRDECGYGGFMPYWDWTIDSKDMSKSPIFSKDKIRGFGGNGLGGGFVNLGRPNPSTMCVLDGAFNNFTVQYHDQTSRPHCLNRGFNDELTPAGKFQGDSYSPHAVSKIMRDSKNFTTFTRDLENGSHGAIHQAIGGDIVSSTSPNTGKPKEAQLWIFWHTHPCLWRNPKKPASLKDKMPWNVRIRPRTTSV
ncbi:unnamed protein product [Fusarium fujikuroi]|nr:unnamed protein product [Fusarium fujikuroi]